MPVLFDILSFAMGVTATVYNVMPVHSKESPSICPLQTIESGAVFRYT